MLLANTKTHKMVNLKQTQKHNLNLNQHAKFMNCSNVCVCVLICATVDHNTALNSFDYFS